MRRWFLLLALLPILIVGVALGFLLHTPGAEMPAGASEQLALDHDGRGRSYTLVVPPDATAVSGLLYALHPSQADGSEMRRMVGHVLEPFAAREGLLVVYPDGFERHFNDCRKQASYSARRLAIDDVGFLQAIRGQLAQRWPLDPRRNYAIGYSNGGHMALRLALEAPALLHGLVLVAANVPAPDNLDCSGQLAFGRAVLIEGTSDPINPYRGGRVTLFGFGDRGDVLSAAASASWLAGAGAVAGDEDVLGRDGVLEARLRDWRAPARGVRLITIEGGGHLVPQQRYRFMRALGARYSRDDVLHNALEFVVDGAR